jgi:hypothetical protein
MADSIGSSPGTDRRGCSAVRETTVQQLTDAGFSVVLGLRPADEQCPCMHLFGPHRFVASLGSPLDGGLYYCQNYPDCPCTGTWGVTCPEETKARYRHYRQGDE